MISERKQAMMRSFASRATIANFLREGFVLGNNEVLHIRAIFGMSAMNAGLWDLRGEIESGYFEEKTGVRARRSVGWTPVVYWDMRRYSSLDQAQDAYVAN